MHIGFLLWFIFIGIAAFNGFFNFCLAFILISTLSVASYLLWNYIKDYPSNKAAKKNTKLENERFTLWFKEHESELIAYKSNHKLSDEKFIKYLETKRLVLTIQWMNTKGDPFYKEGYEWMLESDWYKKNSKK
ncbi:MAG: hypothetical protein MJZ30_11645 [Paludibacteraceae bacterium]|nr:hypothetical protein [Paludibacteraceae bacterium]